MSLAEIKQEVIKLSNDELAELTAFIRERYNAAWDREIEEDFSPGGKHERILAKIDSQIDAGDFTPLP